MEKPTITENWMSETYGEARHFRISKLQEIKEKIRNDVASNEEISLIKSWRRMFGNAAF